MAMRLPSQKKFKPSGGAKGGAGKLKSSIPAGVRPPSVPAASGSGGGPPTSTPSQVAVASSAPSTAPSATLVNGSSSGTQSTQGISQEGLGEGGVGGEAGVGGIPVDTQATAVATQPTKDTGATQLGSSQPQPPRQSAAESVIPSPAQISSSLPPGVGFSSAHTQSLDTPSTSVPTINATAGPGPSTQAAARQPSASPAPPPVSQRRQSPTPSITSRASGRGRPSFISAAAATPLQSPGPEPAPKAASVPGPAPKAASKPTASVVPAPASTSRAAPPRQAPSGPPSRPPPRYIPPSPSPGPSSSSAPQNPGLPPSIAATSPAPPSRSNGLPPGIRAASPIIDPALRNLPAPPRRQRQGEGARNGSEEGSGGGTPNPAEVAAALVAAIQQAPKPAKEFKPSFKKNGGVRKHRARPSPEQVAAMSQPRGKYNKASRASKRKATDVERDEGGDGAAAADSADPDAEAGDEAEAEAEGSGSGSGGGEGEENGEGQPASKKRRYKPIEPEYDEEGHRIPRRRGPYKSRGFAGTENDKRLSKYRPKQPARRGRGRGGGGSGGRSQNAASGDDEEMQVDPNRHGLDEGDGDGTEEPMEPAEPTLGSLTNNFEAEEMTDRAIKLRNFIREKQDIKLAAKAEFERIQYMQQQMRRRKLRTMKNEARRERRVRLELAQEEGRLLDDEVSDDEVDSEEEEFEVEPERLTPPGTPEPLLREVALDENGEEMVDEDGNPLFLSGGEDEHYDPEGVEELPEEDEDGDEQYVGEDGLGAIAELGEEQGEVEGELGEAAPGGDGAEDEDYDPLAAAGFTIGDEDEEPEYDEDGNEIIRDRAGTMYNFQLGDLRAGREAYRERINRGMYDGNGVVDEDDDETKMINSLSFSKKRSRGIDKWTEFDTEFFYHVLSEVGENYSMMATYFIGRDAKQLKRKGLRENREHPEKMKAAILHRKPLDQKYLEKSIGYDPNRSWDKEEALFAEMRSDVEKLKQLDMEEANINGDGGEDE